MYFAALFTKNAAFFHPFRSTVISVHPISCFSIDKPAPISYAKNAVNFTIYREITILDYVFFHCTHYHSLCNS